jgi:hypothetical protein
MRAATSACDGSISGRPSRRRAASRRVASSASGHLKKVAFALAIAFAQPRAQGDAQQIEAEHDTEGLGSSLVGKTGEPYPENLLAETELTGEKREESRRPDHIRTLIPMVMMITAAKSRRCQAT